MSKGNINTTVIAERLAASYPMEHYLHNRFHLEMPFGLINDPNGLVWHDGYYHLFWQWNPLGCEHKNKCWAHTKTRDFINYSLPQLALFPSDVHDKDGCYSGCGLSAADKVNIFYTCNRKEGERRIPAQRIGTLQADGTIKKGEIIIADHPAKVTGHFRDPYLFSRHGKKYLLLGTQRESDKKGTVLLYGETASGWQNLGEIHTELKDFGYMWECPNMLRFGDVDVMLFCPQGLAAREFDRQNLYQAGYIAGHLSLADRKLVSHTKFQELDRGFDFYAPQVFTHDDRHIMLGWMGMPDKEAECVTKNYGWMYSLTMPRELKLRQGHIYSQPVAEMQALRRPESKQLLQAASERAITRSLFNTCEVLLDLSWQEAAQIELSLIYGAERVLISYDVSRQVLTINRNGMKNGGRGVRKFKLPAANNLNIRLFIDRSAIEVFFQQGLEAASLLVYPVTDIIPQLELKTDRPVAITGAIWQLKTYNYQ